MALPRLDSSFFFQLGPLFAMMYDVHSYLNMELKQVKQRKESVKDISQHIEFYGQ